MRTDPHCAKCRKHLGEEKEKVLAMLNRCGTFPKAYCDECYEFVRPPYKRPPKKKGFATTR